MTHWLTRYDPDDGEPYGIVCDCEIDADHDGTGTLNGLTVDSRLEGMTDGEVQEARAGSGQEGGG